MKFIILWIRKNFRYRKANYVLPFLSFVLSAVLLCTSVFYLTLESDYNTVSQRKYPYEMVMKSGNAHDDEIIAGSMRDNKTFVHGYVQDYIDLLPFYRSEIEAFDDAVIHRQIMAASIRPQSALASFYASYGCDPAALAPGDVYAAPYILYYFQRYIDGAILTLPSVTEGGQSLSFRIVGIIDASIADDDNFALIFADDALYQTMEAAYGTTTSLHFYDFADDFVHTRENYSEALKHLWKTEESVDVRLHSSAPIEESHAIYSGDAAIAVFNIVFALLCMVSTLRLKLAGERADYHKLVSLGLSPMMRFLIPFCDIGILVVPSFAAAFPFAVVLFSVIAPYSEQTYRSAVINHYFAYSHTLLLTAFCLFAGCAFVIAGVMIMLMIVRPRAPKSAFIKQSARSYLKSRFHLVPYLFLHLRRNRAYSLFFIFILCFPLFVTAMYGTAAINLLNERGGLFADATYIISRDDVAYGCPTVDLMASDIAGLNGVEAVSVVHKTNTRYTFVCGDVQSQAQIMELNEETASQFARYVLAGTLDALHKDSRAIAVVDEQNRYALGDTVAVKETKQRFAVAAILKNVPLDGRPLTYLANADALNALGQADILPSELHVYLKPNLKEDDYDTLRNTIPSLVYDPHSSCSNQLDKDAALHENNSVTYRVAAAMNVQICIISIVSVFLFHTQKQTQRTREFEILYRLGCSHRYIRGMMAAESFLLLGIGFGLFALLYGGYVGSVMNAIRESGAYQYGEIVFAWKEMILISLGMIGAVTLSDLLSYRPKKP